MNSLKPMGKVRLGLALLAGFLLTTAAQARDRAQEVSRLEVQKAFVDVIRHEILTYVPVECPDALDDKSPLFQHCLALQQKKPVDLGEAVLGKLWPYRFHQQKVPAQDEPPSCALMYPDRVADLDDVLALNPKKPLSYRNWGYFHQQWLRMLGSLDGRDAALASPPLMYASLLNNSELETMAQRLKAELGGNLANWRKVVPLARDSIFRLAVRATALLKTYSDQEALTGPLAALKDPPFKAAMTEPEQSRWFDNHRAYQFGQSLKACQVQFKQYPPKDYFNIFYEMLEVSQSFKKKLDEEWTIYFQPTRTRR